MRMRQLSLGHECRSAGVANALYTPRLVGAKGGSFDDWHELALAIMSAARATK